MYDRVLFPTDGSDGAAAATDHAVELADRFEAPLRALYVVDVRAFQAADAYGGPERATTVQALADEGDAVLERVRDRADVAGVEATGEVVEGTPARTIVDEADPGDVIVMGTHGRTGLDRYLLGSTTEKVVRTAAVPVVTIPLSATEAAEE